MGWTWYVMRGLMGKSICHFQWYGWPRGWHCYG